MSGWESMGKEELAAWWHRMNMTGGAASLALADLPEPKPVHPKRLLAELAEEFDRGVGI